MCALVVHVAGQSSTNVTMVVGLGLPPPECSYWNDGTHSDRAPFCERFSDGLICSGAWDPECVWRVLAILNELVDEVPNPDSDRDGLSDATEDRAAGRDSDNDLIPDYLDSDGNGNDIRDSLEDLMAMASRTESRAAAMPMPTVFPTLKTLTRTATAFWTGWRVRPT